MAPLSNCNMQWPGDSYIDPYLLTYIRVHCLHATTTTWVVYPQLWSWPFTQPGEKQNPWRKMEGTDGWNTGGVGSFKWEGIGWESRQVPLLFSLQLPSNTRLEWKWLSDAAAFYEWNWEKEKKKPERKGGTHTNSLTISVLPSPPSWLVKVEGSFKWAVVS